MDSSNISIYIPTASIDTVSSPTCRICFESSAPNNPMIRPCKCRSKVHLSCLDRWCASDTVADSRRSKMCEVCQYQYRRVANPMNTSPCTSLYQRILSDTYMGACPRNTFKLLLFHTMYLITISGIFYGVDYTRYIESHVPIVGEPYRIYYDLSFASYALLTYILHLFELRRLSMHEWGIYFGHIFTTATPAHLWLLFHVTCCIAIGSYMWKTVAFDIICTIPFYHLTCVIHCDARKDVENSIRIGSIKEYTEDDD